MSTTLHDATSPNSIHRETCDSTTLQSTEKDVERSGHPSTAQDDPPPSGADVDDGYAHGTRLVLVMTAVMLYMFLASLDETIISTAVPEVTNQFNSFTDVGWYGSAYLLTSTAVQPLFGRLYESFSVKLIYVLSLSIFELGSLICGVAQNSPMFIVGRAIAGVGMAGGYAGSLIIINMIAPLERRSLLSSFVGAAYGVGGTIGPLIGGAFTSHATWRWCFYINLIFFAFVGPAVLILLQMPPVKRNTSVMRRLAVIDWLGSALILCSLICLLLVLQWGGVTYDWNDSKIIGLLVGFVVIGVAFVIQQYYLGERATIPFRLLRQRTVGFGTLVNFGVGGAYFGELYFLPIYFQSVMGSTAIRSGVQTLPFIAAVIFTVITTGAIVDKTRNYVPWLIIGTSLTALGAGMLYFLEVDSNQATWGGLQWLAGFGPGMAFMLPFIASSAALPPEDIAVGSAVVIFFQTLGGTVIVSVAQSVFQNKFIVYLREVPDINVEEIISKGVSAFRAFTPPEALPAVLDAANRALQQDWIMIAAVGACSFVAIFGMELNRRIPVGNSAPAFG